MTESESQEIAINLPLWCGRCGFVRVGERGESCVQCRYQYPDLIPREMLPLHEAQRATYTPVTKELEPNGETAARVLQKDRWPYVK